jgi:hypothetical protein
MSSIKLKTINETKVIKVKNDNNNKNNEIKGYDYFSEPYSNIFLLAKKKSGKTTLIYNILKNCGLKNYTKVIIICSTVNKDATYEKIKELCDKNYIDNEYYDDIINDDGENVIESFIKKQKQNSRIEKNMDEKNQDLKGGSLKNVFIKFTSLNNQKEMTEMTEKVVKDKTEMSDKDNDNDNENLKKDHKNIIAPEYIIVIDDLGAETRNKYITQLLKTNRHYKSKVILSSQNLEDLQPAAIRNLDYILLFGGIPIEKIEKIREQILLDIDENKLVEIYKLITNKKYNFMYIDIRNELLRENFNKLIEIK